MGCAWEQLFLGEKVHFNNMVLCQRMQRFIVITINLKHNGTPVVKRRLSSLLPLKGSDQLFLVWKWQTNNVVFTVIALGSDRFTSLIAHQASANFHTETQSPWPIITTYYSWKWIPHICFQWMARWTLLLAYSILLHQPLANRCLRWSAWTLKLRPAAALWQQVRFASQAPKGKWSPHFVYNYQILAAGFVEQFGSKPIFKCLGVTWGGKKQLLLLKAIIWWRRVPVQLLVKSTFITVVSHITELTLLIINNVGLVDVYGFS